MSRTASIQPAPTRLALFAVVALALGKLVLHLATTGRWGYGYFVDELYYLALAEHLDWGFVDVPPLFPALTALVRMVLGDGLLAIRLVPALAGAAIVLGVGLLARALGGGAVAMVASALAITTAPLWLTLHSFHSMNALDPLFWTALGYLVVRLLRSQDPRWFLAIGPLVALAALNKHAIAFYLVALGVGLLATPARRLLATREFAVGLMLGLVVLLPHLVWLVGRGFPHFAVLAAIAESGRDVSTPAWRFLLEQVLAHHPLSAPLWTVGVLQLLRAEGGRLRPLGIAFLVLIVEMLVLGGRIYYPAPAYPLLFAAGAVAWERWLRGGGRRWLVPSWVAAVTVSGAVLAPASMPLLPPETTARWIAASGLSQPAIETHRLGPLPQLLADRFGWYEMASEVARIYHSLPPAERDRAAIFGQNYGQAGAIDLLRDELGLPPAISGHLAYHDWGPRGSDAGLVIVLDDRRERLEELFHEVALAGRVAHPYSMPYQHFDVWICRGSRMPIDELWPLTRKP